jgi:hypothetical protein
MSEFKFSCPQCEQHFLCDEQFSGRAMQCPNCKVLIHIPAVPGKTELYQPESGKTWATFVPSGNSAKPKGLALHPRTIPAKPPLPQ